MLLTSPHIIYKILSFLLKKNICLLLVTRLFQDYLPRFIFSDIVTTCYTDLASKQESKFIFDSIALCTVNTLQLKIKGFLVYTGGFMMI